MILDSVQAIASPTITKGTFITQAEMIALVVAVIAVLGFFLNYLKYQSDRKKDILEAGMKQKEAETVANGLAEVRRDVRDLEKRFNEAAPETAEMKNDIKHIMESLIRIEKGLDRRD